MTRNEKIMLVDLAFAVIGGAIVAIEVLIILLDRDGVIIWK